MEAGCARRISACPAFTAVLASPPSRRRCGKDPSRTVERARVNLSTRRISIVWKEEVAGKRSDPGELVRAISERGHETHISRTVRGRGCRSEAVDPCGRGVGLCCGQHHAAFRVRLVGCGRGHTRSLPLGLGHDRRADADLPPAASSISPPGMRSATGGRTWTCRSHLPSLSPMPCRYTRRSAMGSMPGSTRP